MSEPVSDEMLALWERDLGDGRKDHEPGMNAWAARIAIVSIRQARAERDALAARVKALEQAARRTWGLAILLVDDDHYYGEQRNAKTTLLETAEIIGPDVGMRELFNDVYGDSLAPREPGHAEESRSTATDGTCDTSSSP